MPNTEPNNPESMDPAAACAAAMEAFQRGDIRRARALTEEVLEAARRRDDRPIQGRALQLLGEIEYDELAYPRSLARLEEAIAIHEDLFGSADYVTRESHAFRAVVLTSMDRTEEADAELARAAPAGFLPETPADAARHARLWIAVGMVFHSRERDREGVRIFEAVLAAAEQGEPIDPLILANVYLHYAGALDAVNEPERALAMCRKMLEIRRSVIGVPSLRVALGLVGFWSSLLRSGRAEEARAVIEESASMLRATGHEDHPRASVVYLGLAAAEMMAGRGPASERWITRAIALETKTFGGAHVTSAAMTLTAAKIFARRGHHTRAIELTQRAAAAFLPYIRTRPELFKDAVDQGFLWLRDMKRYDAIIRWLEPLLASLERLDPPPLHSMAPVLNMIGEGYAGAGKLSKAEAALRRSIKITETEYGAESEQMLVLFTNLADLLRRQRRVIEAHDAERRAARIEEVIELRARAPFGSRWRRGSA
jgi:tetratricopeptide (TPR) repeat protein